MCNSYRPYGWYEEALHVLTSFLRDLLARENNVDTLVKNLGNTS